MKVVLTVAAVLAVGSAAAAKPLSEWTREPSSVMGLPLGADATEWICVNPTDRQWQSIPDARKSSPCLSPIGPLDEAKMATLYNLPFDDFKISGIVVLRDRKIASILLTVDQPEFSRLKQILIERYGAPSLERVGSVSNAAGATFSDDTLDWVGRKVTVHAEERVDRIDQSSVQFSDNALIDEITKAREASKQKDASKL